MEEAPNKRGARKESMSHPNNVGKAIANAIATITHARVEPIQPDASGLLPSDEIVIALGLQLEAMGFKRI